MLFYLLRLYLPLWWAIRSYFPLSQRVWFSFRSLNIFLFKTSCMQCISITGCEVAYVQRACSACFLSFFYSRL